MVLMSKYYVRNYKCYELTMMINENVAVVMVVVVVLGI